MEKEKLETLAIKARVTFERDEDKAQDNYPDFTVLSSGKEIGVAWDRPDNRGHYMSVAFEEPSPTPGFCTLVKSGVEKGYTLTYRKPMPKQDEK